jgi:hypothetical protein
MVPGWAVVPSKIRLSALVATSLVVVEVLVSSGGAGLQLINREPKQRAIAAD